MDSFERSMAGTLIELADTLVSDYDVLDYLDLLLERGTEVLGADAGGVLLTDRADQLQLLTSTGEQSRAVELFELQEQDGPCLDAYRQVRMVIDEDLAASTRWPQLGPVAVEQGFRAVFAFPMRLRATVVGVLAVFRRAPGAIEGGHLDAAQAFADMATIGILQERAVGDARALAGHLQLALSSRVVIEQAKGILAERAGLDMDEAYRALRRHARHTNAVLREVAAALVAGGLEADEVVRSLRS